MCSITVTEFDGALKATLTFSRINVISFRFQMEKYSKHLEQIVAERTNDLTIEKQRTDRLLYSWYPTGFGCLMFSFI